MNESIIISFTGMAQSFSKIHPIGFKNFLSKSFPNIPNIFFSDSTMNFYQNGMDRWNYETNQWYRISDSIDSSAEYVKNICNNYKSVYFIGTSIGAYMALICSHIIKMNNIKILIYNPELYIKKQYHPDIEQYFDRSRFDPRYLDISSIDTFNLPVTIYANSNITGENAMHSIDYAKKLAQNPNVVLIGQNDFDMKKHRDSGELFKDFIALMS